MAWYAGCIFRRLANLKICLILQKRHSHITGFIKFSHLSTEYTRYKSLILRWCYSAYEMTAFRIYTMHSMATSFQTNLENWTKMWPRHFDFCHNSGKWVMASFVCESSSSNVQKKPIKVCLKHKYQIQEWCPVELQVGSKNSNMSPINPTSMIQIGSYFCWILPSQHCRANLKQMFKKINL